MTEWREQNRKRDRRYKEKWKNQNRGDVNAWTAKRRAQKIKATPPWADHDKIKEFYREARKLTEETGIPHHVDHIIPLLGDNVSGLHCEGNLRVIPATDNLIKGNEHNG